MRFSTSASGTTPTPFAGTRPNLPLLEVTLTATLDGQPVSGFPCVVRLNPTEAVTDRVTKSGNDGNTYYSISKLATENGFALFTDTNLNILLNGAATGNFVLQSGGFLLLVNGQLASGSNSNVLVNNNTGSTANLTFLEFGP